MDAGTLQQLVDRLRVEVGAPGLVGAVSRAGERVHAASGTANVTSGEPMRTDSGFLFGSVTKVWVTTLLMQLVEEGLVSLDQPVTDVLPDFRTADAAASARMTLRQLVTHTTGIDASDYCPDGYGRGPESVTRYVESLRDLPQLHEPGAYWSYCNPGFVIAGRVIEVVTGLDFDDAFRTRLVEPLGLTRTFLTPEEAILWPAAVGHFADGAGGHRTTPRYLLPFSLGPAGTTLSTTVDDALTFADLHLGKVEGVLSPDGVAAMASHQVDLPVPGAGSSGLGWARSTWSGSLVLGHAGGSFGGVAQLTVVPDLDLVVAAFVNAAEGGLALTRLVEEVLGAEGLTRDLPAPEAPAPADRFVGRFRRHGYDVDLRAEGDELVLRVEPDPDNVVLVVYGGSQVSETRCRPTGPRSFGVPAGGEGVPPTTIGWLVGEDYLFLDGRLTRRVG